jgi:hypothetical protein
MAGAVVPLERATAVFVAVPIRGDSVQGFEALQQVQGVFLADVLNAEVVDDKAEVFLQG